MSNSWWTWAADVDAAIEEKEHQIQNLKDQNKALLHRVECLDSEKDTLNKKVDWLYMMVNKMDSQNKALLQKVKCLESENDTLKTNVTNMMMNKMDSLSSMVGKQMCKASRTILQQLTHVLQEEVVKSLQHWTYLSWRLIASLQMEARSQLVQAFKKRPDLSHWRSIMEKLNRKYLFRPFQIGLARHDADA